MGSYPTFFHQTQTIPTNKQPFFLIFISIWRRLQDVLKGIPTSCKLAGGGAGYAGQGAEKGFEGDDQAP
ncbi:MAG: hypothetical protein WD048_11065, partial [Chitinophagales bacterium]